MKVMFKLLFCCFHHPSFLDNFVNSMLYDKDTLSLKDVNDALHSETLCQLVSEWANEDQAEL